MDYDSRVIKYKKIYYQLGKKFNLPYDIILLIFATVKKENIKDLMKIMNFHCNLTSLNITDPYKTSLSKNILSGSLIYINNNIFSYENLFKYRIPIGKNIEWLIKCNVANFYNKMNNQLWNDITPREKLLYEIKVYTDKHFLEEFNYMNNDNNSHNYEIIPASNQSKLDYIKNTEFRYLFNDYYDYIYNERNLVIDAE
jgi:hypothetical protein